MWNVLVDYFSENEPLTVSAVVITLVWSTLVLYFILKLIVEKAWGAVEINRRKIIKNEQERKKRFALVRERLNQDATAMQRRSSILRLNFFELKQALQKDEISAVDVLDAFAWMALEAHSKTNCLIEFVMEAFDEAQRLDEEWRGKPNKPPLFGLPFSVKGNLFMKGYDCCIGLAKNLFEQMDSECTLVTHLRGQGAIPFVLTNVPQALFSFVCSNPVYGTTSHPSDSKRTPGGSSGGEAALVACGGCSFGTGSDLAGSMRMPASLCGLVTLKPTEGRLVVSNTHGGLPGKGRLGLGFGFFTRSVGELKFLLGNVFGSPTYRKLVPQTVPLPLSTQRINELLKRKLRIGYFLDDGFMKPVPACERVVRETVGKLREAGHDLVSFHIPHPSRAASLFYKNLLPDRGEYTLQLYSNEVISAYLQRFVTILKIPMCLRSVGSVLLRSISPQLSLIARSYVSDLSDLRHTQELTDRYVEIFTREWKLFELDALICPAFTVPSVPHEYPGELPMCAFTTGLFNMLNFPAGVVPTGVVTQEDDEVLESEESFPVGYNLALWRLREAARNSKGMPIGVQVVTLPYEEEECLAVMEHIEALYNERLVPAVA
uniref:Fatty-acid amide hydrolase 1 n=1 Tax=Ascaris suum TaxID=6253 RepID=F1KWP2_ASCSU